MVKHIVFFKLTDFRDQDEKENQMEKMEKIYSVLPEQLPYIIDFRTGRNITSAGHAWDFAIDSVFSSAADLQNYQVSPEHLDAIQKASVIAKEKAMVDYEF
ncbi:MAG: Dabb family protein [Bacteroidales bacterium]